MLLKNVKGIKNKNVDISKIIHNNKVIWSKNVYKAKDSDFVKLYGYWIYKGSELEVELPEYIQGSLVTNCQNMFNGNNAYKSTPVTKVILRHDNVTNMSSMFYNSSATTLDLSSFNTSNVTNMGYMFYNSSATTLDVSSFNTSNVTNMSSMFMDSSAATLDLSSFNTSRVTDMDSMFRESSATTLDLSSFNTSNVTDMDYMFMDSSAATLDLSSFNTSRVTDMYAMFYNSSATKGYARTLAEAQKFNKDSNKPSGLTFVVK